MPQHSLTYIAVEALIKIALLVFVMMTAAAYLVLLERWVAAWVQDRLGPNRVGVPLTKIKLCGLGQPLADGLKFIFKEEFTPKHVDRWLYTLAPLSILATALATFAVIPLGSSLPPINIPALGIKTDRIALEVAPSLDVGLVYIFALSSMAVYGVILGGWASNNKYSLLGGLRSSAQLIAYEIPLGLGILGVVLAAGSLRLETICTEQASTGVWNIVWQPLGFLVFFAAALAESARLPFDLPEAEQELIGGYHTEYAGIRLLLYLVAEFLHMVVAAILIVILYFGGWHLWGLTGSGAEPSWGQALARVAVLAIKTLTVIFLIMLVRWSWPRFRFDQLMTLAWKVMLPLGLVNLVLVAVLYEPEIGGRMVTQFGEWTRAVLSWAVMLAACAIAAVAAPLSTDNRPRLDWTVR